MLDFFKKKLRPAPKETIPIPLPALSKDKYDPVKIYDMLDHGDAIWGWYKADELKDGQVNLSAMLNMTYGFEGLALFRRESDYLVKYRVDAVGDALEICLKISEICKFSRSNVMELFNTELSDAYKLLYDEQQDYAANCKAYVHDLTDDKINDYLTNHRVMIIGNEHFKKKRFFK